MKLSLGLAATVAADGYSGAAGTFELEVEVATAFCGNGVAEAPEVCDDGNTTAATAAPPTAPSRRVATFRTARDSRSCSLERERRSEP